MIRSLWSGVAGLKTHQLQMDVIGNNVSNVNTTSYKAQQTTFSDLLYQNHKSAHAPTDVRAGTNAKQVGLGARTTSIMTAITKQGSIQTTDNAFDLSIAGQSFFVIENNNGEMNYTRDGSFSVDHNGYLVTNANGYYVRGTLSEDSGADATGRIRVLPVLEDGTIEKMPGEATTDAMVTGNISKIDDLLETENGRTIEIDFYGEGGAKFTARVKFTGGGDEDDTTYRAEVTGVYDADHKLVGQYDEDGNLVTNGVAENTQIDLAFITAKSDNNADPQPGTIDMTRTGNNGILTVNFQGDNGSGSINLDFTTMTNYAPLNGMKSSSIKSHLGNADGEGEGYPEGEMNGVSIAKDGTITRLYTNGQTRFAGRIVVAEFANATGLSKEGENLYAVTGNSGAARMMFVNDDGGYMTAGTLEMSNVDLSKEFTNMIITQRGFQANSRVITVSDTLLDELRSLKR